jgi:hypothetical protein
MELLVGTANIISIDAQAAAVTANYVGETTPLSTSGLVYNASKGVTTAALASVYKEGEVEVTWNLDGVNTVKYTHPVSTPYLSLSEMKMVWEEGTDIELRQVEAATRHVINSYCGQSFGTKSGTRRVKGSGQPHLALPEKLLELTDVVGYRHTASGLMIAGGGWYLSAIDSRGFMPPIRADVEGFNSGGHWEVPIRVPAWANQVGNIFHAHQTYEVTGTWGYRYIPQEVKEAAKLLVNDYAAGDNIYRDRYLTSMTAADWRIQFHAGAFAGTGNARADQLLNGFVVSRGWAVV